MGKNTSFEREQKVESFKDEIWGLEDGNFFEAKGRKGSYFEELSWWFRWRVLLDGEGKAVAVTVLIFMIIQK